MSVYKHPLGTVAELDDGAIEAFAASLDGALLLPDDDGYEDARTVWNGLINRYPALVVRANGPADVAAAVRFARETDLELSVRGGAHNQTGSAVVNQGLVIDLSEMDRIEVDPAARTARVGPGTRAEEVLAATQEHGLAFPTGSAGDVGIPGSTLGGGIGWIRRKYGLAVDALRSLEVVTADGEVRRASPDRNEDLFWAVRGGGGNFGVVTRFEFDLYEVGPLVQGLGVFYPAAAAADVLEAYREVTADAPPELTTTLLRGHVPNLPAIPDDLAGTDAIAVMGAYAGDPDAGAAAVAPLREVTEPLIDMSDPMPYELLHDLGTQLFPWGRKYAHRSAFVDDLSEDVLTVVREAVDDAPGPLDAVGVWHLGGNVGRGPASAFAWDDKEFMITAEANWESHDTPANLEWVRDTERRLRDAGAEGAYAGFVGVEEQEWEDWRAKAYGDSRDRLAAVKAEYDPENRFRHNVNVRPRDA
ncbi:FAD-binding oxidoreductase [Halorubrum sp. AD140]|uniref:FAD-binding oxidoreductase n=1 Tax=Halorubrum sp. AD140 TaxID=3050073 RepID=UPI002ACC8BC4|nr:FAD-binding oxidoreductase [Halorubrum sp. AD140]MDZ5812544.1 FAD-binding oxidoreductase [Halorubrum sp. AD140]